MHNDYITDYSDKYNQDNAQFSVGSPDAGRFADTPVEELETAFFIGAMREMVICVLDRYDEASPQEPMSDMLAPENLENIYITSRPYSIPVVVTEYTEVPEWFQMKEAELREFYWHPDPAESAEPNAAYFQPRQA